MQSRRRINVLIGIAIALSVCGLVLSGVARARAAVHRMECAANLKQIGHAVHNYHSIHGGFPRAAWPHTGLPPEKRLSWLAAIAPYLDTDDMSRGLNQESAWDAAENSAVLSKVPRMLQCPSKFVRGKPDNSTHYVGIAGVGPDAAHLSSNDPGAGIFGYERDLIFDPRTGSTLMVIETALDQGPWLAAGRPTVRGLDPNRLPYIGREGQFGGFHSEGANAIFGDGSRRRLKSTISPTVLEALATVAGGEKVKPNEL